MKRRTTTDYADAIGIIKECYDQNGGEPLPGSIRAYCDKTARPEMASICTVVHASLIKLGILSKLDGRYVFTDDPAKHLEDVISCYTAGKKKEPGAVRSFAGQRPAQRRCRKAARTHRTRYADTAHYGLPAGRNRTLV